MNRPLLLCLPGIVAIALQGCAIYADSSGHSVETEIETKGQQFSRCLDNNSPEICDERINGTLEPRSDGF